MGDNENTHATTTTATTTNEARTGTNAIIIAAPEIGSSSTDDTEMPAEFRTGLSIEANGLILAHGESPRVC